MTITWSDDHDGIPAHQRRVAQTMARLLPDAPGAWDYDPVIELFREAERALDDLYTSSGREAWWEHWVSQPAPRKVRLMRQIVALSDGAYL